MNIDHVNRAHSAKSHKSDLLSKGILQTTASLHHTHDALSELTLPSLEAGLYFSLTLFNLLINSDVSFIKITKRLRENKKKYDELSALVKPVDVVVDKVAKFAVDHAGDPKFADPITSLRKTTLSFETYFPYKIPALASIQVPVFNGDYQIKMTWLVGIMAGISTEHGGTVADQAVQIFGNWHNFQTSKWHPPGYPRNQAKYKRFTIDDFGDSKLIQAKNTCGDFYSNPFLPLNVDARHLVNYDKIKQLKTLLSSQNRLPSGFENHMKCYEKELFKEGKSFAEIESQFTTIKQETSSYPGKRAFEPSIYVMKNIVTTKDVYDYNVRDYPVDYISATPENYLIIDDELQKIIDLVKHLQPSSTLTLAQLRDVSTALKLSELRSIVNDGNRKMLALNALNQKDLTIINEQTNNMQVLSEFFSRVISSVNAMAGYFGARS